MKIAREIIRYFLLTLVGIVSAILIFVMFAVAPVDRTPIDDFPAYNEMMQRLDTLHVSLRQDQAHDFLVGYNKTNFTPGRPTATAGYGKRKGKVFTAVRDSIFIRTLVIDNGVNRVAIVSADLLIIPPTVTEQLSTRLKEIGFNLENTYLGATHSHNSIGNWGEGVTRFLYGKYEQEVVDHITNAILKSISEAQLDLQPARLSYGTVSIPNIVKNRMRDNGSEDPLLRTIQVHRSDRSKLLLMSYTAHATCLYSSDLNLSRDYPGALVDKMEEQGFEFAMFMAGAVGSHGCDVPTFGPSCISYMVEEISTAYNSGLAVSPIEGSSLMMKRIRLSLPDPQLKFTEDWKVRSWVFRAALGEYPVYITVLKIGDLVMLGAPCDYSGEFGPALDAFAAKLDSKAMVTSFNGGYIGYVTPGKYYDVNHYETRFLNWYPPGTGEYITTCFEKLIAKFSKSE